MPTTLNTNASVSGKTLAVCENPNAFTVDQSIAATKKLYFDGASDTYLYEKAANTLAAVIGGAERLVLGAEAFSWAGFGTHLFSAGGTGVNDLRVVNPTAGTGNYATVHVGTDVAAYQLALQSFSSTFTTNGPNVAAGSAVHAAGVGGLSIVASHASGAIRLYAGGTTEVARINNNGASPGGGSALGIGFDATNGGGIQTYSNKPLNLNPQGNDINFGTGPRMSLSSAGLLSVSAVGTHSFTTSGNAAQILEVRNTTNGASAYAAVNVGNNVNAAALSLAAFSTTWGGTAPNLPNAGVVSANDSGGLSLAANNASGAIRFYSGGTTLALTIAAANQQLVATAGYGMTTWPTTANAANAWVSDANLVSRSTSSLRYKTDIERLDAEKAKSVVASLSPITYRGVNDGETRFAGFAAEEVAALDPMLVTYDKEGRPDYVTYDRIPAYLVPVVQDQERRIALLEAKLNG